MWRRSRSLAVSISSCDSRTGAGLRILLRSRVVGGCTDREHSSILFRQRKKVKACDSSSRRGPLRCYEWAQLCFTTQTMEGRTARESVVSEEGQVEIRVCRAWRRTVSLLTPVRMEAENYA